MAPKRQPKIWQCCSCCWYMVRRTERSLDNPFPKHREMKVKGYWSVDDPTCEGSHGPAEDARHEGIFVMRGTPWEKREEEFARIRRTIIEPARRRRAERGIKEPWAYGD